MISPFNRQLLKLRNNERNDSTPVTNQSLRQLHSLKANAMCTRCGTDTNAALAPKVCI